MHEGRITQTESLVITLITFGFAVTERSINAVFFTSQKFAHISLSVKYFGIKGKERRKEMIPN